MPLVQRSVKHNHAYGHHFFETPHAANRLEDTHMGGCAGSLKRLGLLADYAADIFKDLIDTSTSLHDRIVVASKRVEDLADQLPEAISFVDGSRIFLGRIDQPPADGSREQIPETSLLEHISMPRVLQAQFQSGDMHRMPNLESLDKFVASPEELQKIGGTLANKYSNPNFVKNEWIKKNEEENLILANAKEAKRQERRAKKAKKVEIVGSATAPQAEKKKAFNWKDSLKNGGDSNVSNEYEPARRSTVTNVQNKSTVVDRVESQKQAKLADPVVEVSPPALKQQTRTGMMGMFAAVDDESPQVTSPAPQAVEAKPPPVPLQPAPPPVIPQPVPPTAAAAPPPPPLPTSVPPPPMPPVVSAGTGDNNDDGPPSARPLSAPKLFRPPPPPPPRAAVPPPAAVPTAPSTPGAPPPPPPPPRAAIGQNAGAIDLLTAIRRGSMLKKVEPAVASSQKAPSRGAFGGTAVESILARRKALQQEDDDSSSDEDGEW